MGQEIGWIRDNMKSFGEYESLVRAWCIKHEMSWIMEEFKELFNMVSLKSKKEVFDDIDKLKISTGSHSMIDEEDYQQLKERHL